MVLLMSWIPAVECRLFLHPRDYGRWLVPRDAARLPLDLLRPLPAEETEPRTVSSRVGNVLNNGSGLVELSLQ